MRQSVTPAKLTLKTLLTEAGLFTKRESNYAERSIYAVTDGKAVGTYVEQKFRRYLAQKYTFPEGNSAKGIDFPHLSVDLKVTSIKQPQSSCPFESARQKIFGLGYSLLVFVYKKADDPSTKTATLNFLHTIFVQRERTGDYQTTSGLIRLLENKANEDDLMAFMSERHLPLDDVQASKIAKELLKNPPTLGYLTISPALQWRLQYKRIIDVAGKCDGVVRVR